MKTKLIYALLSIVIAFGLWLYVITVVSPESEATYYDIPVVLNNESVLNDKGLMISVDKNPTVTLRLKGNRSDLNNLKNSDITLVADLSKINDPGLQQLNYDISFPGSFAANAFEVLSQMPDRIELDIVEWSSKEVDVTVNLVGSVPRDYIVDVDSITQDHERVTITGPKTVIDQITQARVDVDVNNQTQTISQSYRYTLTDANGEPVDAAQVLTNVAEVNVTVKILRVKTIQLLLDVVYGGGAAKDTTSIVMDYETIKIAGSEKLLETLGDTLNLGTVNVAEQKEDEVTLTFPVNLPDGIENLSGVTEITATVSFPELKSATLTLTVSSNMMYNVPEGMTIADIGTKICRVTVRGPASQINSITPMDLLLRVDLTGAELGEGTYKAQIQVNNTNYSSIGVVGTYPISVKLEAATAA